MNNPLNKIDISKSSLLGLKAELLRKKNEFDKLKLTSTLTTKPVKKVKKLQKIKEVSQKEPIDPEEAELMRKSKEILEKKAKIYDNLTTPGTSTADTNDIYLVQFAEKQTENLDNILAAKDDHETSESDNEDYISSDDEVEYVDYFGRSHVYPRKDIKMYIEKDKRLSKMLQLFPSDKLMDDIEKLNIKSNEANESLRKTAEMMSSDMKRELMRQEWEKQEELLKLKNVIHYQDILFDEARMHGVSYYQFSADDAERALQHKALDDLRHETLIEQKKRAEHRSRREQERKARVLAAKNRVRARKGLPPLEPPDESEKDKSHKLTEEEQLAAEKAERDARYEKKKQEMRSLHVRPWDVDKEGTPIFNEMSQEQWVEKQRNERKTDFAPPSFYKTEKKNKSSQEYNPAEPSSPQSSDGSDVNSEQHIEDKLKELRSKLEFVTNNEDQEESDTKGSLRFSTKPMLKRKNMSSFTITPIVNEVIDNSSDEELAKNPLQSSNKKTARSGAEIPPPLTFEYFGPNPNKSKRLKTGIKDIEESISAGLEYLKDKVKNKRKVNIDHLDM